MLGGSSLKSKREDINQQNIYARLSENGTKFKSPDDSAVVWVQFWISKQGYC
jgi:hypothetical protein